jgi:hypothetical protein
MEIGFVLAPTIISIRKQMMTACWSSVHDNRGLDTLQNFVDIILTLRLAARHGVSSTGISIIILFLCDSV